MLRSPFSYVIAFILYIIFQVYVLDELTLFGVASGHVFLLYLFMLPAEMPIFILYLITFFMGLIIDSLSNTYLNGLHAASALIAIGVRPYILQTLTANYRNKNEILLHNQTYLWYAGYLLSLFFIHHVFYYFLEAFSFRNFFFTWLKILGSTLYSFLVAFLLCILFYKKK